MQCTETVKQKRLRIDLASLKQEIGREQILVKWIPRGKMVADALSKKTASRGKMVADALSKKTAPIELVQNVLSVGRLELQS